VALFRLGRRRQDGSTERDHLLAHERATGERPPELDVPPVPPGAQAIWGAFCDLSAARPPAAAGVAPFALSEICAWQSLHGVVLSPWEVDTLLAIDRAALAAVSEASSRGASSC